MTNDEIRMTNDGVRGVHHSSFGFHSGIRTFVIRISPSNITLTPALSRITGRGGKKSMATSPLLCGFPAEYVDLIARRRRRRDARPPDALRAVAVLPIDV